MSDDFYHKNIFGEIVDIDFDLPEEEEEQIKAKKSDFNIFALTDAVGARNKKDAWILYQKALASGMVADEIFWRIVWIVKSMLITTKTKSHTETDMKEFPYKKAKGFAKNFSKEELINLSEELVIGYHNARRGIGEIDSVIEKMILKL
jgi:hypothetical protein